MKKEKKVLAAFLAGIMLVSSICLLPASVNGKPQKPALDKKKITTTTGKTVKIRVKKAKGYKITWKSKKKKLATVKKAGKYTARIKAKKSGTVKILAKVKKGNRKYNLTCKVKIKKRNTSVATPVSTGQSVTKPSAAPVSTTPGASAVATGTGSHAVETDSASGQSTDIPAPTLPEESAAAPTDGTSTEPTDRGDATPSIRPTGGTAVTPTDSSTAKPTDNTGVKPTDNTGVKPTANTGGKPTDSTGTKPTDNTGTQPTDNTGTKPTDNTGTQPTDNTGTKPTDNTGTQPTDNTGTKPTDSSGTKPTGSGTLPTAGTVETAAPTPTKKATPTPVATLPPTAIQLELTEGMFCDSACVDGTPTYNEDGSVTVTLKNDYDGGGIGFYIDSSKENVDLSDFSHIKFDVTAEESTPLTFQYYVSKSFWNGTRLIGYGDAEPGRATFTYELGEIDSALGFGLRYNAYASTGSRTLTIHSITLIPDEKDITEAMDYTSLAELASAHNLKMGTVMNVNKVVDKKYKELTKHHFNSITAANEMKAYSLLDQQASIDAYTRDDGMPVMDYTQADKIMKYAQENGIKVRGHVLVWDADMCDWFFREGYESDGAYVSKETLQERVKSYINKVMNYFQENYPGVIYCWDVVNEAVGDSNTDYSENDGRHVRTHRNGVENQFYEIMGDHYVEESFWYAREVLDGWEQGNKIEKDSIKLYYNDYSTYVSSKRDAIIELVKSINSYKQDANGQNKKLCDGVGMQSYIGGWYGPSQQQNCMKDSDIADIKTAVTKFGELGVEVQVTELAVRSWSNTDDETAKHAAFYKKLMQAYLDLSTENNGPLTAISIWGLYDDPSLTEKDYSYRMNGTYCGLFTETCAVKDSFKSVYEVLGGTDSGQ